MISLIFLNALVTAACITSSASSVGAKADGTVNSVSIPCAGYIWQPKTWSNVDGRATLKQSRHIP